ncbi:MAG: TauD/TfdA family dioxygenase [Pseudomonadota bacterium]
MGQQDHRQAPAVAAIRALGGSAGVEPEPAVLGARVHWPELPAQIAAGHAGHLLRPLLAQHQVLLLPDQRIAPLALQDLAEQFGDILEHGAYPSLPEAPRLQILESTPEQPSKIEQWHTDMTFSATPPPVTVLHAQILPPVGGDTLWLSTSAAFEALSPDLQAFLRTLTAEHDFRFGFRESLAEPGGAQRLAASIAANPPVQHPVVLEHPETGRAALYVNPLFTTRIASLAPAESDALLSFLYGHMQAERFVLRLRWTPDMLVIWDNRSTQHRPETDYLGHHRRHLRATLGRLAPRETSV